MKNLTQRDIQHIIQLHEQGDYKSAIKQAQSFIKHLPNEIFLWNILGACFEKTGD